MKTQLPISISKKQWLIAAVTWPIFLMFVFSATIVLEDVVSDKENWQHIFSTAPELLAFYILFGFSSYQFMKKLTLEQIAKRFLTMGLEYGVSLGIIMFIISIFAGDKPFFYKIIFVLLGFVFTVLIHMVLMPVFLNLSQFLVNKKFITLYEEKSTTLHADGTIIDNLQISYDALNADILQDNPLKYNIHEIPKRLSGNQYLVINLLFTIVCVFLPIFISTALDGAFSFHLDTMGEAEFFLLYTFPAYVLVATLAFYRGWNQNNERITKTIRQLPIIFALCISLENIATYIFYVLPKGIEMSHPKFVGPTICTILFAYTAAIFLRGTCRYLINLFWQSDE